MTQGIVSPRSPSEQHAPLEAGCAVSHTRRALLGRVALAGLATVPAGAVLAAPLASEPDPHAAWFAEWRRLVDHMNSPAVADVPDIADLPEWGRHLELEHLIGTTPARTVAGVREQLRLLDYHLNGCSYINDDLDAALANALSALERLAGEVA